MNPMQSAATTRNVINKNAIFAFEEQHIVLS